MHCCWTTKQQGNVTTLIMHSADVQSMFWQIVTQSEKLRHNYLADVSLEPTMNKSVPCVMLCHLNVPGC